MLKSGDQVKERTTLFTCSVLASPAKSGTIVSGRVKGWISPIVLNLD